MESGGTATPQGTGTGSMNSSAKTGSTENSGLIISTETDDFNSTTTTGPVGPVGVGGQSQMNNFLNNLVGGSGSSSGSDVIDSSSNGQPQQNNAAEGVNPNPNANVAVVPPQINNEHNYAADDESKKYCWVCFATDEDDLRAEWVKPCRCKGTSQWVHVSCITRWIDEKQKGNSTTKVSCPQCNSEYMIYYPKQGFLVVIMDSVDSLISRVCPFVAAGIVVGSIYWTSVTFGAVTVMQVAGHKEGLSVMEQADPLVLLVGLPTIPVMLIVGKMVRWEDQVLRFIRKHSCKIPVLRHILPSWNPPSVLDRVSQDLPALSDPVSATRILCGALLLPTVATIFGKVFFENVKSNFRRALLGGLVFISIKGVLRIYHKQQQYIRQQNRKITDFVEPAAIPTPEHQRPGGERGESAE